MTEQLLILDDDGMVEVPCIRNVVGRTIMYTKIPHFQKGND